MLPCRLVGRTRCQGAAPLGGTFTHFTGISHFSSCNSPTAARSTTAAMPIRMPLTRGEKPTSPFCCTRHGCCTPLLVEHTHGLATCLSIYIPPSYLPTR